MASAGKATGEGGEAAPAADRFAHLRFTGTAAALIVAVASIAELLANWRDPGDRDFLAPWAAGKLALSGQPAAAYDPSALHSIQAAAAHFASATTELPFPYPPIYLLAILPFALLPFAAALAAWSAATFAFYIAAARRLMPGSGLLAAAFPAAFVNAAIGQNGFLTAGLFMLGCALLGSSPLAGGLLLGCLIVKPQLALMIPVAMIAGRQWRAIAGALASSAVLMIAGLLLFGVEASAAWLAQAPLIVRVTGEGLMGWDKLISVYSALRAAGLGAEPALAGHIAVAALAALAVWRSWRSEAEPGQKIAMLGAASLLASPYLFLYDSLLAVPAFLYLARERSRPWLVAALWALPLLTIARMAGLAGLSNLAPLIPLGLVALLTFAQPSTVRISQPVGA